ncbi:aspartyl protease family protein [Flavobacterium sp. AS60]|uniref:aspartyl protease family protein n=1 Tax=Flavobacterium anseongense TaxID=2910677 RepID=UPI001F4623E9|nr:aspartyl protease family protein [Flavobacterium sp. AS60]MCF6128636.1 aspartyl protease family protein [Flavobacterium sp. AS60]
MRAKLLLFFLLLSVHGFSQSEFKINNLKNKVVIPFKLINNLIFIPVTINGEELTFLLDTGVEQTILFSLDEKDEVKLFEVEKLKLRGLGSKEAIDSYKSSGNKVEIKDFVDYKHEIYVVLDQEFNFSSHVGIPVNGIMGSNFFKKHIVEINYDKKRLTVYDHNHIKINSLLQKKFVREPITIEDNKPYCVLNIKAGEQTVPSKLLIDTGNSDAVWVFLNRTDKIKLPEKNIQDYLGRGFSGNVYGKRARLSSFEFGNKTFNNPLITFPDSTSLKSVNFVPNRVGSLGSEIISRFTVVFDYVNNAVYTKPNKKIADPFHFNMSGIEVEHAGLEWVTEAVDERTVGGIKIYTDNTQNRIQNSLKIHFTLKPVFKIASVRAGSESEKAGLKVGDKIIRINRQTTHWLSIQSINELLKSEEGKAIEIEIERNGKPFKFKFQLKNII